MGKFSTFVCGGLVGAAIALLVTPRTGEENRQLLLEKINETCPVDTDELQGNARRLVDNVATTSTKVINTVVDKGQDVYNNISQAQSSATVTPEVFTEKNDELRQKIDAARERIATQVAKNAEAVHDAAVDKAPAVVDAVASVAGTAKEATAPAAGAVKDAASSAKTAAKSAAGAAAGAVKSVASTAKTKAAKATKAAPKTAAKKAAE